MAVVLKTEMPELKLLSRGKVRDIYDLGEHLLIVASDRISAFDYVLASGIPDKGKVLTMLSEFWFDLLRGVVEGHVVSMNAREFPSPASRYADMLQGRSMLVRKARMFPVECVVRGYLAGSGWKEYLAGGATSGVALPAGLRESDRLPSPIFAPAFKAESGHDENISLEKVISLVGRETAEKLRDLSLAVYTLGARHAEERGILVADTKFEFGVVDGRIVLCDEVLTPDSSRFWPKVSYRPGGSQPSLDKQFVRDYLERIGWDKKPPVPSLPDDIVQGTSEKYREIYRILTGRSLPAA